MSGTIDVEDIHSLFAALSLWKRIGCEVQTNRSYSDANPRCAIVCLVCAAIFWWTPRHAGFD